MITVKLADLEQENISLKKKSEITFQNKIYKKQKVVSKREEAKIVQIAEEYDADNLEVLLVEHKVFFSLWVEKASESATETLDNQQSVKKIVKHYRGVSYEVEVPDHNAQNTPVSVKTRKYRGQSY